MVGVLRVFQRQLFIAQRNQARTIQDLHQDQCSLRVY